MHRIDCSVKRMRRKFALSRADGDDLRQDFCVAILQARQLYDPDKCILKRFVAMVINRRYKHHVRRQMRLREGLGNTLNTVGFDDVEPGFDLLVLDPVGENLHRRVDQRDALDHALRDLSEFELSICDLLLAGHTSRSASRELKVAPSTVIRAMQRIAVRLTESKDFSNF